METEPTAAEKQEALFHKIRSLLRKAESSTFEEEARSFYTAAQTLMLRYRIDEVTLWNTDPTKRQAIQTIDIGIKDKQPGAMHKRLVLLKIAQLSECRMYYMHAGNVSKVVGFPQDLVWVEMLYSSIMSQASFAMARAQAIQQQQTGINTRTFRNNFYRGFAVRITERLQETYDAARKQIVEPPTGSTALVLASRRQQVDDWVNRNVNLGRGRVGDGGRRDEAATRHGKFAADTTDITGGKASVTSRPRGELNQ